MSCKKNGSPIVLLIIFIAIFIANAKAEDLEGVNISTEGKGATVIFIPGLNSASDVFKDSCIATKAQYQCLLLQLPGFAGSKPVANNNSDFLIDMRDRIEKVIQHKKLTKVILVGHSLGGTLSLMIAQHQPELVTKLIILDALPFYSAIQNPAMTAELMQPQAEQMRSAMLRQTPAEYLQYAAQSFAGMTNQPERIATLTDWLKSSDRATTANAMYSMMLTDLRKNLSGIKAPTFVLGSWAAFKPYGATQDSTKAIFTAQYAELKQADIRMSETGYHFLMWDDAAWVNQQILTFLK
jgi:pimeloyl-ACP methyl ester carboxylesterase